MHLTPELEKFLLAMGVNQLSTYHAASLFDPDKLGSFLQQVSSDSALIVAVHEAVRSNLYDSRDCMTEIIDLLSKHGLKVSE